MDLNYELMKKEAVDLLQKLIRNKCENFETVDSAHEIHSVNTIIDYLAKYDVINYEIFEAAPSRASLLVKLVGSDPSSPSLMYESHLDVVPANEEEWDEPAFEGLIKDGFVWGRGAIDMLYFTATQVVSFAHLSQAGFKPKGDLILLAIADEEAGGDYGAKWLVENIPDKIKADYMIGEFGGAIIDTPKGKKAGIMNAEKGIGWFSMKIRGEPGHASMPYKTNNAILKSNKILSKISQHPPKVVITDAFREFITGIELSPLTQFLLLNRFTLPLALKILSKKDLGLARAFHALTRMTIVPTVIKGGTKSNIIPDLIEQTFDVRLLPGQDKNSIMEYLKSILGKELYNQIELEFYDTMTGTYDPIKTPLTNEIRQTYSEIEPEIGVTSLFLPAVTDARIFRQLGIKCYGFSVLGADVPLADLTAMAHGNNEKVPVEAVHKSTIFFTKLALNFLS